MYGGGRYDGLVELFGVEKVPTVGFGMGDVTLENFLRDNNLIPLISTETELCVILANDVTYDMLAKQLTVLRDEGVRVAVDISGKKIGKQIENATKRMIPYGLIIGSKELAENHYALKDLRDGSENIHSLERIISIVKARN